MFMDAFDDELAKLADDNMAAKLKQRDELFKQPSGQMSQTLKQRDELFAQKPPAAPKPKPVGDGTIHMPPDVIRYQGQKVPTQAMGQALGRGMMSQGRSIASAPKPPSAASSSFSYFPGK